MTIPPISMSFDYGIKDQFSVGGLVGFAGSETSTPFWTYGDWKFTYTYIIIGARGAYHFDAGNEFDPYVGLLLGYNIVSFKEERPANVPGWLPGLSASGSYMTYGGYVGGRYYVSDNMALFAELGYGLGYLTAGVSFKM